MINYSKKKIERDNEHAFGTVKSRFLADEKFCEKKGRDKKVETISRDRKETFCPLSRTCLRMDWIINDAMRW